MFIHPESALSSLVVYTVLQDAGVVAAQGWLYLTEPCIRI